MANSKPMLNNFMPRVIFLISALFVFSASVPPANQLANDVLKYTNEYRRSKGLKELIMKDDLNSLARKHSEEMASGKLSFGHSGYDQRVAKVKKFYGTSIVAENVAYGARDAKEVFSLWKKSTGHRKNMLGNYKYIGIGTAKNKRGVIYYTEIFVN
jgi:uncharacterized protein YkwD